MRNSARLRPANVPATMDPNFEERFEQTWLQAMVEAGVDHISKTEFVDRLGAEDVFWSAVCQALGKHIQRRAKHSFEFDRYSTAEEAAELETSDIPF